MGDTQIHVMDEEGSAIDLGGVWDNANRWSTAQGVKGTLGAWMQSLKGIGRLLAFSDGLSAHAAQVAAYSDGELERVIRTGARLPTSDDVAIIDVALRTPRYEGYADPDLPDPNAERPQLKPIWNPMGKDSYELQWEWPGNSNARFIIQEATNPALTDARVIDAMPQQLSWRPSEPQPPGHYYYRVRAVGRRGTLSPWSELRQTLVAQPVPDAPLLEIVARTGETYTVNWSDVGDVDYTLQEADNPEFIDPEVVYQGRSNAWSAGYGAREPGVYYYRVQAVSDGGPSAWSETQRFEFTLPPPPVPHLAAASYTHRHGAYELRWQAVRGAEYYELEEVDRETGEAQVAKLEDTRCAFTDKPVGNYVYRVRACHQFGCSEWSSEQLAVVAPLQPTHAPVLEVDGPDVTRHIRLSWTPVHNADAYELEIADDAAFRNARIHTQSETTFALMRREPGALYFRVRGVNAGGEGPWSEAAQVALLPDAPGWIEATLGLDRKYVDAAWGSVGGQVSYHLQLIAQTGDEQEEVTVYQGPDTQCTAPLPPDADRVALQVRAEHPGGHSAWQVGDSLEVGARLAAPKLDPPALEGGKIGLSWGAVDGATHYLVEVGRDPGFNEARSTETPETRINVSPPVSGQYWFRVRACQGKRRGAASNVESATVERPSAPRLWPLDPVKADTLYEIAWEGVPGCTYYELQEAPDDRFEPGKTRVVRVKHPGQKYTVEGRPPGRYHYRVQAVDDHGQTSAWSDVVQVVVE